MRVKVAWRWRWDEGDSGLEVEWDEGDSGLEIEWDESEWKATEICVNVTLHGSSLYMVKP